MTRRTAASAHPNTLTTEPHAMHATRRTTLLALAGLAVLATEATRVTQEMFICAARAVA